MPPRDVLWQLTITSDITDGLTVLGLSGRVSHATCRALVTALDRAVVPGRPLVIDLSGIDYISSAGFHALEQAAAALQARDARLIVCGIQEAVRPAFELAGPLPHVTMAVDRDEALSRAATRPRPSA